MARKAKRARSSGGNRPPKRAQTKSQSYKTIVPASLRSHNPARDPSHKRKAVPISERYRAPRPSSLSQSQLATRANVFAAHADMQRDPTLTAAEAARQNGVAVRDFWKYLPRAFRKDSHGRIRAIADRYVRRLEIPGPHGPIVIKVRGSKARAEVARFRNDVFRFLGGDRTALDTWKGVSIQGNELLTDPRILEALGEQGNLPEHFGSEQVIPYFGVAK
jgi:hypothetical protein